MRRNWVKNAMKEIRYHLKTDYISQDKELLQLINETVAEYKVTLLVAPQGTGKSYFFQKTTSKEPNIIISPTRALADQYYANSRGRFDELLYYSNTFVGSKKFTEINTDEIKYLIIDEIHKAVQYSSFAYSQTLSIMRSFEHFYRQGTPIILVTATPELLSCLEGYPIYDNIGAKIEITTDKKYIQELRIMDNYSDEKIKGLVEQNYRMDPESMQIVLINSTKSVEKVSKDLNDKGIKSIGITSKNRRDEEEIQNAFNQLTNNELLDYSVVLATSWLDVGINFLNENITDIYCIFDDIYSKGDFTLLWQFMARARKSKPKFYITEPRLSEREDRLIDLVADNLSMTKRDYLEALKESQLNTEYLAMYDILEQTALDAIELEKKGLYVKETTETITGVYYEHEYGKFPKVSSISIKYFMSKMIEKLNFSRELLVRYTNCTNIKSCVLATGDYNNCTDVQIKNLGYYFEKLIYDRIEFSQDEIKGEIDRITDGNLEVNQLKTFIKNNFEMKLVNHKRSKEQRLYRLFFDYNYDEVCGYCDSWDISFTQIGYARYTKESMEVIKVIEPTIEIISDKSKNVDEYFIDISCIDKEISRELFHCLAKLK